MASQDNGGPKTGAHEEVNTTLEGRSASSEPTPDAPKPPETEPIRAPPSDDNEDEAPLHLEFRAPTFQQREEKISQWGMRLPGFSAEWQTRGETLCIRSKITAVSRTLAVSISGIVDITTTTEYGESFPRVHADLEVGGHTVGHQHSHVENATVGVSDRGDGVLSSDEIHLAPVGFRYEKSVVRPGEVVLVPNKIPPYVVLGIFSGAYGIPKERMVTVKDPSRLFWHMFWAIVRLRGIGYFLSLKDVQAFSIYKVSICVFFLAANSLLISFYSAIGRLACINRFR
jgi:hypothetical protein